MSNRRKASLRERLRRAGQDQDGAFFDTHPTVTAYERPATALELRATGYPPGTRVYVQRVGVQCIRAFAAPDERVN
jgi:hypothetical protein